MPLPPEQQAKIDKIVRDGKTREELVRRGITPRLRVTVEVLNDQSEPLAWTFVETVPIARSGVYAGSAGFAIINRVIGDPSVQDRLESWWKTKIAEAQANETET